MPPEPLTPVCLRWSSAPVPSIRPTPKTSSSKSINSKQPPRSISNSARIHRSGKRRNHETHEGHEKDKPQRSPSSQSSNAATQRQEGATDGTRIFTDRQEEF